MRIIPIQLLVILACFIAGQTYGIIKECFNSPLSPKKSQHSSDLQWDSSVINDPPSGNRLEELMERYDEKAQLVSGSNKLINAKNYEENQMVVNSGLTALEDSFHDGDDSHQVYKRDSPLKNSRRDENILSGSESKAECAVGEDRNNDDELASIQKEIHTVYKDISDNVRTLAKLQDLNHSNFPRNKKRSVVFRPIKNNFEDYDDSDGFSAVISFPAGKNKGLKNKRCNQEMTVEVESNRDATPDKLDHVERKTEEEILQVNVPLRGI